MLSLSPWSVLFVFPWLLFRFHVVCSSRFLVRPFFGSLFLGFVPFSFFLFFFLRLLFLPPLSVFTFLFPSVRLLFFRSFVPFSPRSVFFSCFPRSAPSSVAVWALSSWACLCSPSCPWPCVPLALYNAQCKVMTQSLPGPLPPETLSSQVRSRLCAALGLWRSCSPVKKLCKFKMAAPFLRRDFFWFVHLSASSASSALRYSAAIYNHFAPTLLRGIVMP